MITTSFSFNLLGINYFEETLEIKNQKKLEIDFFTKKL